MHARLKERKPHETKVPFRMSRVCISADVKMVLTWRARGGLRSSIIALQGYLFIVYVSSYLTLSKKG